MFTDFVLRLFGSDAVQLCLCLGPVALASVLLITYYALRWRYQKHGVRPTPSLNDRFGRLVLTILFLPIPLHGAYFALNIAVVMPYQSTVARREADALVDTLDRFHQITHRYPSQLEELVPIYLDRVPDLVGQQPYLYEGGDGWYLVRYSLPGYSPVTCRHSAISLGWYYD